MWYLSSQQPTTTDSKSLLVSMEASEAQPPTVQPLNAGNEASFSDDPHISFDQATGKWHYEADDGKEFEYDVIARAWVPIVSFMLRFLTTLC